MPSQVHEVELIGGPLDGYSWTVLVGQPAFEVPIDRLTKPAPHDAGPADSRTHRYEQWPIDRRPIAILDDSHESVGYVLD